MNLTTMILFLAIPFALCTALPAGELSRPADVRHVVVHAEEGKYFGWPANNGVSMWDGREILVGFVEGRYDPERGFHKIAKEGSVCVLARSGDGGETWEKLTPTNYIGTGTPTALIEPIDFSSPGFAMRVVGTYRGTAKDPAGRFYYSLDKGRTWRGPHTLNKLSTHPELEGLELTPRTDYLVTSPDECLVFLSAKVTEHKRSDRTFCARTTDGGRTFEFVSWIVPPSDPHRAVMPSTVQCPGGKLVSAIRRRPLHGPKPLQCWVDAYASDDDGKTWAFLSRIGETGANNGNPPALVALQDGRLCCVYGDRTRRQILARYSSDNGETWGDELIIRGDEGSEPLNADLGYSRVVQRADGKIVAIYYWNSRARPQQHIAASIWSPE